MSKYSAPVKQSYREEVWDSLLRWSGGNASANAMILCGPDGAEIPLLLKRGFMEENIHVVDINPGVLAMARAKYPDIHAYCCSVSTVVASMKLRGVKIDYANLDFCGTLATDVLPELRHVLTCEQVFSPGTRMAVTYLAARDNPALLSFLLEEYGATDRASLVYALALKHRPYTEFISKKKYQSGKSPMEWVAFNG